MICGLNYLLLLSVCWSLQDIVVEYNQVNCYWQVQIVCLRIVVYSFLEYAIQIITTCLLYMLCNLHFSCLGYICIIDKCSTVAIATNHF